MILYDGYRQASEAPGQWWMNTGQPDIQVAYRSYLIESFREHIFLKGRGSFPNGETDRCAVLLNHDEEDHLVDLLRATRTP